MSRRVQVIDAQGVPPATQVARVRMDVDQGKVGGPASLRNQVPATRRSLESFGPSAATHVARPICARVGSWNAVEPRTKHHVFVSTPAEEQVGCAGCIGRKGPAGCSPAAASPCLSRCPQARPAGWARCRRSTPYTDRMMFWSRVTLTRRKPTQPNPPRLSYRSR